MQRKQKGTHGASSETDRTDKTLLYFLFLLRESSTLCKKTLKWKVWCHGTGLIDCISKSALPEGGSVSRKKRINRFCAKKSEKQNEIFRKKYTRLEDDADEWKTCACHHYFLDGRIKCRWSEPRNSITMHIFVKQFSFFLNPTLGDCRKLSFWPSST